MRLLLTRAREDSEALAETLGALGHETVIEPLLSFERLVVPPLDLAGVQALLATSRQGAMALAEATAERDLPLFAVGEATAAAARSAGFRRVESAEGDALSLAALLRRRLRPRDGGLLHGAGEIVARDLGELLAPDGFRCRRVTLYRALLSPALSPGTRELLRREGLDGAVFLSPRTAAGFVRLAAEAGVVDRLRCLVAYCLSPAVAAALAPAPWAAIRIAPQPSRESLLSLLAAGANPGRKE